MNSPFKRYYTDYCMHMWRFFILNRDNENLVLESECDIKAIESCRAVYDKLSDTQKQIMVDVHTADRKEKLSAIIAETANRRYCTEADVFKLLSWTNRNVALVRGLIR